MGARVLLVDNFDSFTYNLVQELGELGADPVVFRNDAIDVTGILREDPDAIVISPGPGRPDSAGVSIAVVEELAGRYPILGVCLGHQTIGQVLGGTVVAAPTLMHGKTSVIHHTGHPMFAGVPRDFTATRYHSLVVDPATVPDVLEVTATSDDGVVMAFAHREQPLWGVQFHPESILSPEGPVLLANFLALAGR